MKLSVLEHGHINEGRTVQDTLRETVTLAKHADELGFSRFWMSEHHGSGALSFSSPEVMIAHVAAHTDRIRVGSGGVMLPHYSAYKVAENFRLLEALHPGRIDLGIGRAPGGMPIASRALNEGKSSNVQFFPQQIADLGGYFHEQLPEDHRFASLVAGPSVTTVPEVWLLGSSSEGARIAAAQGTAYAFAQFFGTPGGEEAMKHYRRHFKPSILNDKPHSMIAVSAFCAETEEAAAELARSNELFFLRLGRGLEQNSFPSLETVNNYPFTAMEMEQIRQRRSFSIVGTPDQVKDKITAMAERYEADEVIIASAIHSFEDRLRSFSLIAEAFNLKQD
ncbi:MULTISPECIES: LLM class flavin-dependent oxidoreductase [unclassified Paenibacillus]|uniref:LLM class flavin-dependent oxidoreductase n=1 Tax=unclassified Paenibacillus TaxID=185978 RepID=UPI0009A80037|nr:MULTISPECIES: LLM class flavin-dependent oxidoreductase [unclassified Paenibacillus]SLJ96205.1 luciferase family oxidoreductase, group 1 [Paenibacillus sp. RU5A]SOC67165.1 luciferase family oxidoreductase, group 1 [Paenibacillus sp. RU26A]SOC69610.1 luciferase family oxidoreductase, group 1 [Paenibacillus sp. RU5M]